MQTTCAHCHFSLPAICTNTIHAIKIGVFFNDVGDDDGGCGGGSGGDSSKSC